MVIDRKKLEHNLGKKLNPKIFSIGIDTASRAGWATVSVKDNDVHIECGFIDIRTQDLYFKYNQLIKSFESLFSVVDPKQYKLIIEDTFFGKNVNVLKMISRMGMIAYITGKQAGIEDIEFVYPTSSRKKLGIKGTLKKAEVHKELTKLIGVELDDPDISDAIVLALYGIIQENNLV
jgi:Holliday junction resolvasome RuvABC endonuclease subunit